MIWFFGLSYFCGRMGGGIRGFFVVVLSVCYSVLVFIMRVLVVGVEFGFKLLFLIS